MNIFWTTKLLNCESDCQLVNLKFGYITLSYFICTKLKCTYATGHYESIYWLNSNFQGAW